MIIDRLYNVSILYMLIPALFVFATAIWLMLRTEKENSRSEIGSTEGWTQVIRSARAPFILFLWVLVFGVVIGTIVYFFVNWREFNVVMPYEGF